MGIESPAATWRPLTTGDAKAAAELLNAMEIVDKVGENYDEEDVLLEFADPYADADSTDPYADLERSSLAAFDGDVMIGYMKANHRPVADGEHRVFVDGGVHPEHRRRGIGTVLLKAGIAAAKELHALHHPTAKLVVETNRGEHIPGAAELYRSQGFAPVRYYQHMEHPLGDEIRDVPIPDGLRIEPWSEQTDEEFLFVRNESFKDHWGSVAMPADTWKNRITNHTFRPELSFLLRDAADGAPAGMLVTLYWEADTVATGLRDAHFMIIGTLRKYRKRGAASALISHTLRAAAEQGYDRASLGVDAANPSGAFGVYEKAGFVPEKQFVRWAMDV
jgi:mycothiol synthase